MASPQLHHWHPGKPHEHVSGSLISVSTRDCLCVPAGAVTSGGDVRSSVSIRIPALWPCPVCLQVLTLQAELQSVKDDSAAREAELKAQVMQMQGHTRWGALCGMAVAG